MKTEKKRRVVITGLGTVNPTGNTVAESWAAIKDGRCAVEPITAFDTADFKVKLAAEVKNFDPAERIDKREARKMARFTQFAVAAAEEAIGESGLALEEIDRTRFGVILSSGIGGLPTIEEEHTRGQQRGFEKVSPYFVPMSIGIWRRDRLPSVLACRACAAAPPPPAQAARMQSAMRSIVSAMDTRTACSAAAAKAASVCWVWAALPA